MTTFIDFRYSAAQAAALRQDNLEIEQALELDSTIDGYLVFDVLLDAKPGHLATIGEMELVLEPDRILALKMKDTLLKANLPLDPGTTNVVAIRFGPTRIGLKYQGAVIEAAVNSNPLGISSEITPTPSVRILGRDTDRAIKWARLFYYRQEPCGLCLEVVMDWQNPQAGIPSNAIATVEEIIAQTDFKLRLTSYACDEAEAKKSDFSRLFSSETAPQVTLHIAPPIYTRANPSTVNIGLFVVESMEVAPSTVHRCNEMDSLIVPTRFVENALRLSGVTRPIKIIPHGVDLEHFKPAENKVHLKSGKSFNILSIAAYTERKNIYHLARAYMEEFRITEDIALHLYIRPEYLTTQHNILQEFTEWENWHFNESGLILISTSYVSRAHLRDLYANADVYLMPSNEGFGFTLLEAMACGTPAIGLGHGGQVDFLNSKNGYVVAPGKKYICQNMDFLPYIGDSFFAPNARQLRKTLRHIFNNREELKARGLEARRSIEARFSWAVVGKAIAESLREAYREYAGARQRSNLNKRVRRQRLTWMIGVVDDANISPALRTLTSASKKGANIICLFTRYGNVRSALKAKRKGLLLYRWDTTLENFKSLALQLTKSPWVGLIYSHERLSNEDDRLDRFLAEQPEEVVEVRIKSSKGLYESRLFRQDRRASGGRVVEFDGLSLS